MNPASRLKIIYYGTPAFAVAALDALVKNNHHIVAVVTVPDRPAGRGQQLQESAVKKYAVLKGIPVFQPEKLSDPVFLEKIKLLGPDLQIVVAFRMMPEKLWRLPRLGTFNLHASLLPKYRGAAPINYAIINGEKETGVTTFFLKHEIDTGDILFSERTGIGESETAGELHDRLMMLGASLVLRTVAHIAEGDYQVTPQARLESGKDPLPAAPKIHKQDCRINWDHSPGRIHNHIRGLCPHPGAWTEFTSHEGKKYQAKIFKVYPVIVSHEFYPGMIETDGKKMMKVYCKDGYIQVEEIQFPGKKRMKTEELLNGFLINGEWRAE